MKASKLIELLQKEVERVGDKDVTLSIDMREAIIDEEIADANQDIRVGYEEDVNGSAYGIVITNY